MELQWWAHFHIRSRSLQFHLCLSDEARHLLRPFDCNNQSFLHNLPSSICTRDRRSIKSTIRAIKTNSGTCLAIYIILHSQLTCHPCMSIQLFGLQIWHFKHFIASNFYKVGKREKADIMFLCMICRCITTNKVLHGLLNRPLHAYF